jgi:hypothetical protein
VHVLVGVEAGESLTDEDEPVPRHP